MPNFSLQVGELNYNGVQLIARPLTLPQIALILSDHGDVVRDVIHTMRSAKTSGHPDESEIASIISFAALEPAIVQAIAISTGCVGEEDTLRQLPGPILAQFAMTVFGVTVGVSSEELRGIVANASTHPLFSSLGLPTTRH